MKVPFEILLFVIVINVFIAERHRNKVKSRNSLDNQQKHHPNRHHGHNQIMQRKRLSEQHPFKGRNGRKQNKAALQNNQRSFWGWVVKAAKKVTKVVGSAFTTVVNWFTPLPNPRPRPRPNPPPPRPVPTTRPPTTTTISSGPAQDSDYTDEDVSMSNNDSAEYA
ncbi:uncharacterized protein Dvir_GJ25797, isoform B [Drosophila virilis]|uniref:Uncharacterized protein, isoform B n=1 Tax=Drosophila virilis TaxID=7244 RepID=A0A0Q9WK54_DROVI|nr:uncharacterized protein LOC26530567 isoform X2 [Drosophila virilis]KRF85181.1 uncharacterized protein Dvir_GJ25797, isoform B [Drosophila virilis]